MTSGRLKKPCSCFRRETRTRKNNDARRRCASLAVHGFWRRRMARGSFPPSESGAGTLLVWFAASAKFLIPFSLLVGLGTLVPHRAGGRVVGTKWMTAAQEFSQPFTFPTAAAPFVHPAGAAEFGYLRAAAWLCGRADSRPFRFPGRFAGGVFTPFGDPHACWMFRQRWLCRCPWRLPRFVWSPGSRLSGIFESVR